MQDSNFSVSVPGIQWIILAVFIVWILLMGFVGWRKGFLGSLYFNLSWLTFFFLSFTVEPYIHEPLHEFFSKVFSSMGDAGEFIAAFVASFIFFLSFVLVGMILMSIIYHLFVRKAVKTIRNYYHKKHSWFGYTNGLTGAAIGVLGGLYTFTLVNNITSVVFEDADENPVHDFLTSLYPDIPFLGNVNDLHEIKSFATDALSTFDGIQDVFSDALGDDGIVTAFLDNPNAAIKNEGQLANLTEQANSVGNLINQLANIGNNSTVNNLIDSSPEVKNSIKEAISEPLSQWNELENNLPDPDDLQAKIAIAESDNPDAAAKVLAILPEIKGENTSENLSKLFTQIYPEGDPEHDSVNSLVAYLEVLETVKSAS